MSAGRETEESRCRMQDAPAVLLWKLLRRQQAMDRLCQSVRSYMWQVNMRTMLHEACPVLFRYEGS